MFFRLTPWGGGAGLFVFGEVLGEAVDERFEVGVTAHEFQVHIRVFTDAHFIKAAIAVCQCARCRRCRKGATMR